MLEKGLHDVGRLVNYPILILVRNDSDPPGGREWRYE